LQICDPFYQKNFKRQSGLKEANKAKGSTTKSFKKGIDTKLEDCSKIK
jgi:hypothetical protein